MFNKSFLSVFYFLSAVGTEIQAVQLTSSHNQTCAKVPKRSDIQGLLSPRSGTLMDLGPCTSFLSRDSENPGPQNCDMPQDPGNPGPQDFDMQRDPGNT